MKTSRIVYLAGLELFQKNVQLFRAVISTLEVNKELLESRAYESFSVVTDIADQMYRSYEIPFRKAHSFVSFLVKKAEPWLQFKKYI